MMKNILLVFICLLSFSVFSQNQKSSTLDYKKTEKSEIDFLKKRRRKRRRKRKMKTLPKQTIL